MGGWISPQDILHTLDMRIFEILPHWDRTIRILICQFGGCDTPNIFRN